MIEIVRTTNETRITGSLSIEGDRTIAVQTGIGFFDHMLSSLAFWAGWDLELKCEGDLEVDTHHTVEDAALALGGAFYQAWKTREELTRIAYAFCPLDEALSRVVVDLCNRPYCIFDARFQNSRVGDFETSMTDHFFRSFAQEARITLHLHSLYSNDDHHGIETLFKATGLALHRALEIRPGGVASLKGVL